MCFPVVTQGKLRLGRVELAALKWFSTNVQDDTEKQVKKVDFSK